MPDVVERALHSVVWYVGRDCEVNTLVTVVAAHLPVMVWLAFKSVQVVSPYTAYHPAAQFTLYAEEYATGVHAPEGFAYVYSVATDEAEHEDPYVLVRACTVADVSTGAQERPTTTAPTKQREARIFNPSSCFLFSLFASPLSSLPRSPPLPRLFAETVRGIQLDERDTSTREHEIARNNPCRFSWLQRAIL